MAILNQTGRPTACGSHRPCARAAAALGHLLSIAAILCCLLAFPASAQVEEYTVKAAFLYNFAKFVEWPPQAFDGPADPICICVLGRSSFGFTLNDVVRGKTANGRRFQIRQIADGSKTLSCHILFVDAAERKHFQSMAGALKGMPILTVGESPGFASAGGIINLKLENGKVRFEINVEAAEQAQLRISSKLLSLADVLGRPGGSH